MDKLIEHIIRLLTSTGPWLSKKWLLVLPAIGVMIAFLLMHFGLVPTVSENDSGVTIQYYKWMTVVLLPTLLLLMWGVGTQLYLRSGQGVKIGLVYESYKVDVSDWKQTRTILKDLFKHDKLKHRVSLRFVPLRAAQAETIGLRFAKRYGFTILLTLEESKAKGNKLPLKLSLKIQAEKQAHPFLKTTIQNCLALMAARINHQDTTALDILKNKALSLRDLLLLFVATHDFITENYEDASVLLGHIDTQLAKDGLEPMKPPRVQVRDFFVRCCLSKLEFPANKVPHLDELKEGLRFAENAMPLFDDFAGIYTTISKARFLLGDEAAALQLTQRFKDRISSLQNQGQEINNDVMYSAHLNFAFLSFTQGHWHKAASSFRSMFEVREHNQKWGNLVEFIDYVESLDRYDGICYLQVLYRKIAGQRCSVELCQNANKWIHADGSRKELDNLLSSVTGSRGLTQKKRKSGRKRKGKRRG